MYDLIIIGGGIIGLATGYRWLEQHPGSRLLLLEKEDQVGQHQSGHNSGVIHSGLYYRPGSRKAQTCRAGVKALRSFCDQQGIPYQRCGKVVVATSTEELPRLQQLYERGQANGVAHLQMVGSEELRELEPHVRGLQGLVVPSTGIVDFTQVTRRLQKLIINLGGQIHCGAEVLKIYSRTRAVQVVSSAGEFITHRVINCGGLYADELVRKAGSISGVRIIPFRGEYYVLRNQARHLVKNLIYPVPDPSFPFLGVHFTRRMDGTIEAGPNAVLALAREGYTKTDFHARELQRTLTFPGTWRLFAKYWRTGLAEQWRSLVKGAFVKALQRLIPELQKLDLRPGGSGVRAQALDINGRLLNDFHVEVHGQVIHVLNTPSPGATSSLAIGQWIVNLVEEIED